MITQSPSGLFTLAEFKREGVGPHDDYHFCWWVHAKAKGLAAALGRRITHTVPGETAGIIETAAEVLWKDAGWARGQVARLEGEASARRAA